MAVSWKSWNLSWKGGYSAVTLGDLIDAIKKVGNGRLAKSTVLQELANAANANLCVGVSTLQKACNQNGVLQNDVKARMLANWGAREQQVLAYIDGLIKDVNQTATLLGVPKTGSYDKSLLCKAIRYQFEAFFADDAGTVVDNNIPEIYQKLLENPDAKPVIGVAYYSGDAAHDYSKCRRYTIDIYGTLQHEIELQNTGTVPWVSRSLVFADEKASVRPSRFSMLIPETSPKGIVKLRIDLAGRGAECSTRVRWKMVDSNGHDCFPAEPNKFYCDIETTFTPID